MIVEHLGKRPVIHASAYVAPTATVCGDVRIGAHSRVMFGASVIAEGARIEFGEYCVVLHNAVLRSTARHATRIGDHCLVGPNTHLVGCNVEDEVFIATGVSVFHGARLGRGCEVRVNAVVHVRSHVQPGETVPIGWVAVGDPAKCFPPDQHDAIWSIQAPLDFPLEAYGIDRAHADMRLITEQISDRLASHRDDRELS